MTDSTAMVSPEPLPTSDRWRRRVPASRRRTLAPILVYAPMLALAAVDVAACTNLIRENSPPEEEMPPRTIEEVLANQTPAWMRMPGVVGTGLGLCDGDPCIRVFLARPSPEARERIPEEVEGHRVELVIAGEFQPLGPDAPEAAPVNPTSPPNDG